MSAQSFICKICGKVVSGRKSYAYGDGRACKIHPEAKEVGERATARNLDAVQEHALIKMSKASPLGNYSSNRAELSMDYTHPFDWRKEIDFLVAVITYINKILRLTGKEIYPSTAKTNLAVATEHILDFITTYSKDERRAPILPFITLFDENIAYFDRLFKTGADIDVQQAISQMEQLRNKLVARKEYLISTSEKTYPTVELLAEKAYIDIKMLFATSGRKLYAALKNSDQKKGCELFRQSWNEFLDKSDEFFSIYYASEFQLLDRIPTFVSTEVNKAFDMRVTLIDVMHGKMQPEERQRHLNNFFKYVGIHE